MAATVEQKENERLKQANELLKKENGALKIENERLKASTNTSYPIMRHSNEFWLDIKRKLNKDMEYIKDLVKNKKMTVHDRNRFGETLLIMAARYGSYDLAQFCLNAGADIDATDDFTTSTALEYSRKSGYLHIEQLLLFHQMNVNAGNAIVDTADIITKQNGINENILNELTEIGEQTKDIFCKTLMELMINTINKRLAFDDSLINLCWDILCMNSNDPMTSDLWKTVVATCKDIINNGTKKDWYWLKNFMIASTIWYRKVVDSKGTNYLYFSLLELVKDQSGLQLNTLESDLNALANKNQKDWKALIEWDIPDEYAESRQDGIPNGIEAQYTYSQLLEKSTSQFNAVKFYDHNEYLSNLVLLAQIVDDDFQKSVQKIFNINAVTQIGTVFDTDEKEQKISDGYGKVYYSRGPVKLIERAKAKSENDYFEQRFPTTAMVLDLNRCSLVFNDIHSLLSALQLFVNKIKYFQSGVIIGIVRDKNGFKDYVQQTQYADIKLNVLIKGKKNNIIGEVQFLLKTMKEFKNKAHNLYAIERQKEYIETGVSKILPLLLDKKKQLFIAANRNDVKALSKLMILNNLSIKDLMQTDDSNQNLLHRICSIGNNEAFLFLKSIMSKEEFIEYLFIANTTDIKAIEYTIYGSNEFLARHLYGMKEIQQKYTNDDEIFRIVYWIFVYNTSYEIVDYIMSVLNISVDTVKKMIKYIYKPWEKYRITVDLCRFNTVNMLKKFVLTIGKDEWVEAIWIEDGWGTHAFLAAIESSSLDSVKYLLAIQSIKQKCMETENLRRIESKIKAETQDCYKPVVSYVKSELGLKW